MRNLWIFISRYNAFFLFLIFEGIGLFIYVKYNSFQQATFINSANQLTGYSYARVNELQSYISLREENEKLASANAQLRGELKSAFYIDTLGKRKVNDTVYKQQYVYIPARVINNSINRRNNYLTINRGGDDGIKKGQGVICAQGVVGIVMFVGPHMSVVRSLLHKDSKFSAMLASNKAIGSMVWSDDLDPHKGLLLDVTNNIKPHVGELVVTSGYSLFPAGIPYGKVSNTHAKGGGFFLNMEIALSVDFSKLQYVDVVIDKFAEEQAGLEAQEKKDEQ
ncbi:rod shape-determining protein MreC [Mucilaginibacter yixingensis]|uniref:Cell shape-determining protein MreC n=1 Tax=Mucilaginibacter yixingensis TaxID=1295612 RepID=A0A2T5JBT5_9SPHI|nr:rod shape-determining protein MreC [Mucilaginibacter yixingensis]PTQ99219.1 rod shape-determining protein MreC [Mucilaginibacter yixingensis]